MTVDYGTELDMGNEGELDVAANGGTVSGVPLLAQAARIRLSTPRGSVLDAPDDGIDVTDWLSKAMGAGEIASLEGTIELELLKDERFFSVKATVDASTLLSDGTLTITLEIVSGLGPFTLTLGVGPAGVAILGGA